MCNGWTACRAMYAAVPAPRCVRAAYVITTCDRAHLADAPHSTRSTCRSRMCLAMNRRRFVSTGTMRLVPSISDATLCEKTHRDERAPSAYVRAMKPYAHRVAVLRDDRIGATFHVSPTGNDSAAGTDTAPFLTIQHAADRVPPGDTVVVHAGTYTGFTTGARGTQAAPIRSSRTARSTSTAPRRPTATRSTSKAPRTSRSTASRSPHATRAGISALDCDHITIRNNVADQNAKWGIFSAFCDDLVGRGQRGLALGRAARHLRLEQRRPPGHPRQQGLGQRDVRHPHERRHHRRAATA